MSIVCCICQDRLTDKPQTVSNDGDLILIALGCGHLFHQICAERWFQEKPECPYCSQRCRLDDALRIFPTCNEDNYDEQSQRLEDASRLTEELLLSLLKKEAELSNEATAHNKLKSKHAELISKVDILRASVGNLKAMAHILEKEKEEDRRKIRELEKQRDMLSRNVERLVLLVDVEEKMNKALRDQHLKNQRSQADEVEKGVVTLTTGNGNVASTDPDDDKKEESNFGEMFRKAGAMVSNLISLRSPTKGEN